MLLLQLIVHLWLQVLVVELVDLGAHDALYFFSLLLREDGTILEHDVALLRLLLDQVI